MGNFITESNVYTNLFMCDSHEKVVKFPYLIYWNNQIWINIFTGIECRNMEQYLLTKQQTDLTGLIHPL